MTMNAPLRHATTPRRVSLASGQRGGLRAWAVPTGLIVAAGLLTVGLSLPVLHVQKLVFWKSDYSIVAGIRGMWAAGQYGLAALIFFFSVLFPYAKLGALGVLWYGRFSPVRRGRLLEWLKVLGKWSMLDVFVVAVIVVITKSGGPLDAEPRVGIYVFGAAVVWSLVLSMYVDRVASRG